MVGLVGRWVLLHRQMGGLQGPANQQQQKQQEPSRFPNQQLVQW
jgi:hypothetical protein